MVILNSYVAPDYNFEWNRLVPKKVSFVAWRALLGRLPTFDALVRRNIAVASNMCPFCGEVEETVEHVFISCGLAQSMWSVLAQWCKCLWKKRNAMVHRGTPTQISSLVEEIKVLGFLWIEHWGRNKGLTWEDWS
ncbi:uncharacterized protein LOC143622462 [Bidens hawaiensis]|uniref:uncharacterized protein LOC143622453 n=1 Tax=Bidens hawaiensis TaxID=980011 RepID=UPI00404995FA